MVYVDWALMVAAILVAIPLMVLGVEAMLSLLPRRRPVAADRLPCAILVPAHNEASGISSTINNLRSQVMPGDRIVVVADNCDDDTASIARSCGVEAIERHDPERRGKGFALAFGLEHLKNNPAPIVVIVDADCELAAGALDALVRQVAATHRPAQGIYLIGTGEEADVKRRVSAFAVLIKNQVRPLGLDRLGMPCLLTGTGMAFPVEALAHVELGTGNIVEDMKLGVDLAIAGHPPRLCPSAQLSGSAAPNAQATQKQRSRWEHGHVQTIITQLPRLILASFTRFRVGLVGLTLELAVPPVSLLLGFWALVATLCTIWWLAVGGSWVPALICGVAFVTAASGVFLAWVKFGQKIAPIRTICAIPLYMVWKMPIYLRLLKNREKSWVRTERAEP